MVASLDRSLDYVRSWLGFQFRLHEQPGVAVAIGHRGEIVLDEAFGLADLARGAPLTPRHRMRVASHSKSFTAAGIMLLVERGLLRLDDRAGGFVPGLHPGVAQATIGQLLSHSGGIVRDGPDSGQFIDRMPYRSREELLADLGEPPPIEPGLRMKYSNHGYGLLGLVAEAVTGRDWAGWASEHVIAAAGLRETAPDIAVAGDGPIASGHSGKLPLGRRVVIPARNPTRAIAPAAGFLSTASDLVRFFGQLDPAETKSLLSVASRREMTRRHWRDEHCTIERYYGLGLMSGPPGAWSHVGHSGGFQGVITRTAVLPEPGLTISVLTNAADGFAHPWLDGIVHILRRFEEADGLPETAMADWTGRWWSLWGAVDLVPVGTRVLAAFPAAFTPFADAAEIEVTGPDQGRIAKSQGYGSPGEAARLVRSADGTVQEAWIAGACLKPEADLSAEMEARYGAA